VTRATDRELVSRARAGEAEAFAALMERYRDVVCAIAYSYLRDWDDVQDAAQETFVQAYLRLQQLREPEKLGAWLRRIAANVCMGMLRRPPTAELRDDVAAPDDAVRSLTRVAVADALGRLPEKTRVTTALFYIGGLSHAEVAALLEVPLNTVRSRLRSARRRLAEEVLAMVRDELQEGARKVRIRNPRVIQVELREPPAPQEHADFLYGLVNVLGITFGEHLRAIFRAESYAWDDFMPLCFIYRDGHMVEHRWKLWSVVEHLMYLAKGRYRVDPLHMGDEGPFYDAGNPGDVLQAPCTPMLRLVVKEHSLLLWGEDIRPRIELVQDRQELLRDVLAPALNWLRGIHYAKPDASSALDEEIRYPLSDPAPERPDRGYGDFMHASLLLLHIARALVFLKCGQLVLNQMDVADAFAQHVGGPWAELVCHIAAAHAGGLPKNRQRQLHLWACRELSACGNCLLEAMGCSRKTG